MVVPHAERCCTFRLLFGRLARCPDALCPSPFASETPPPQSVSRLRDEQQSCQQNNRVLSWWDTAAANKLDRRRMNGLLLDVGFHCNKETNNDERRASAGRYRRLGGSFVMTDPSLKGKTCDRHLQYTRCAHLSRRSLSFSRRVPGLGSQFPLFPRQRLPCLGHLRSRRLSLGVELCSGVFVPGV